MQIRPRDRMGSIRGFTSISSSLWVMKSLQQQLDGWRKRLSQARYKQLISFYCLRWRRQKV
ncbi:hypothetical protein LINGRAHAP2_LOCUS11592 [Linum grandiflorum]